MDDLWETAILLMAEVLRNGWCCLVWLWTGPDTALESMRTLRNKRKKIDQVCGEVNFSRPGSGGQTERMQLLPPKLLLNPWSQNKSNNVRSKGTSAPKGNGYTTVQGKEIMRRHVYQSHMENVGSVQLRKLIPQAGVRLEIRFY